MDKVSPSIVIACDGSAQSLSAAKLAADLAEATGHPAYETIEYMHTNPGIHLVLGRRGYSTVRSLTLGSVSEKIVRHATGPVTVVGP